MLHCANEIENKQKVLQFFEDTPFNPSFTDGGGGTIQFTKSETPKFLEYIGPAPPGFEYKWEL